MLLITFMAQSLTDPSTMKNAGKSLGLRAVLIVVLTVVAYIPAIRGGFIWDDDSYVTDNQTLRSLDGLRKIWVEPKTILRYYPLTYTCFWGEYHLWKLRPLGYHLVNVLLHAANAVLVWLILRRLKIPGAWVAGLVFALHPVNVATVAWITEHKNTLSMFFYAGAILLYLRFAEEGRWRWYGLSLAAFLLALLSKTAVVMLPVVLLGCIWWLRGRVRWKDFVHSAPFFILSLVSGWVSVWVENWANIEVTVRAVGFFPRLAGAGWAAWFYLCKALLPLDLTVVYPRWEINASHWVPYVPGIVFAGCLGLFWWKRQTWGRPPLFGLAYFTVTLFPVLGFFDIGFYLYSLVADHWQYYSIVAPIALAAAGWELIYRRMGGQGRYWGTAAGVAVLMVLGVSTWRRSSVYANSESLWRDTVAKNPNAWVAHYNLANELSQTGRMQEAIGHYEQAVQIRPNYEEARNNLAFALMQAGDGNGAIRQLQEVLRIRPESTASHYNLGKAYLQVGRFQNSIVHLERAVQLKPDFAEARYLLGNALSQVGELQDAIAHYEQAVRLKPDFAEAHNDLGVLLAREGRIGDAISEISQVLRLLPDYPEAHKNLAVLLARQGKPAEAIPHLLTALRLNPNYAEAHYTVAILLAQEGKIDDAISHLQNAFQLEPGSEKFRRALESLQRAKAQPETR